jgi:hypothetical protein
MMSAGGLAIVLLGAVVFRRSDGVTVGGIEGSVAPTFSNLVQLQRSLMGLPTVDPSILRASAQCHKVGPVKDGSGAGSWTCTVSWLSPGQRTSLRDTYDLSVTMDGCYTATADGSEAHLGGPTLVARDGTPVVNWLYAFDSCFDTTAQSASGRSLPPSTP